MADTTTKALDQLRKLHRLVDEASARDGRFARDAYLFVLDALQVAVTRLETPRHVTGQELASAFRDHALDQFGALAHAVVDHWGVRSTEDIGRIVFTLIDLGLLSKSPTDRFADFVGVYDFGAALQYATPGTLAQQS